MSMRVRSRRGVVGISSMYADNRKDAVVLRTRGDCIVLILYLVINSLVLKPARVAFFIVFFVDLNCGHVPVVLLQACGQRREEELRRQVAARGLRGLHAAHCLAAVWLPQRQTL